MRRIIIAGIDTEVGKTVVATIVTEALSAHYWKPVQCGMPRDTEYVGKYLSSDRCYEERFCLQAPLSPHLAAEQEGIKIRASDLVLPNCSTDLIIEGTGGILTPLNETESWIDAAMHWDAEWIIVHRPYLGSYNHFLLTIEALKQRKARITGVIVNGEVDEPLFKRVQIPLIGRVEWQPNMDRAWIQKMAAGLKKI